MNKSSIYKKQIEQKKNDADIAKKAISCVDLFCGVGGLTNGLIKGGIQVVAGIDLDPDCRFPYESNNDAILIGSGTAKADDPSLTTRFEGAGLIDQPLRILLDSRLSCVGQGLNFTRIS